MTHYSRFAALATIVMMGCSSGAGSDPSTSPAAETSDNVQQGIQKKALTAPVTGTLDGVGFSGVLRVTRFVAENDQIFAIGTIGDITVPDASKRPGRAIAALKHETLKLPVSFAQPAATETGTSNGAAALAPALLASCDVLFLQLGPLDLNLLGLVVHLDQVTLDIDAQTGGGELLGNLLCAITGLLDPLVFLENLGQIADLLNQIIALIGLL